MLLLWLTWICCYILYTTYGSIRTTVFTFWSCNLIHINDLLQSIHDDFLAGEIEMFRAADNNQIPPPLEHLQSFMANLEPEMNPDERASSLRMATFSCMRDMFHYARVSGLHVLECVMDTALSAVKKEQLQEASIVRSV